MKKIKYRDAYGEECWTDEDGILLMCELFKGTYYMWEGYLAAINDMNKLHGNFPINIEASETFKRAMDDYKRKFLSNIGVNTALEHLIFIKNHRYTNGYFIDFHTECLFRIISREILDKIYYSNEDLTPELQNVLWKEYYFKKYDEVE